MCKEFDMSLKITWIRKILTTEAEWIECANHYKVNRLIVCDIQYQKYILEKKDNIFWGDVATAYIDWYSTFKNVIVTPAKYIPILHIRHV